MNIFLAIKSLYIMKLLETRHQMLEPLNGILRWDSRLCVCVGVAEKFVYKQMKLWMASDMIRSGKLLLRRLSIQISAVTLATPTDFFFQFLRASTWKVP